MTRLYWAEDSTKLVWNICINFDTRKDHLKLYVIEEKNVVLMEKVLRKNHVNRENKSLEPTT